MATPYGTSAPVTIYLFVNYGEWNQHPKGCHGGGRTFYVNLLALIDNPNFDKTAPEHPLTNPKVQCLVHMIEKGLGKSMLTEQWRL